MNVWTPSHVRTRAIRRVDAGFTLIEVMIALVLSAMMVGVVAAALVTSLHVARSTTDLVADSSDAGLISAYLIRDAQSSAATDPSTAVRDAAGIFSPTDPLAVHDPAVDPWSGCEQQGALVVRFSWIDRTPTPDQATVVTYALDDKAQLTRKICTDSTSEVDVILGRNVRAASADCDVACTDNPSSVSLTLSGLGTGAPLNYVLKASLRPDTQGTPTSANSMAVPLVTLGPTSPCPNLNLAGTGTTTVIGSALIDSSCGAAPIGNPALLKPTATTILKSGIADPFSGREAPSAEACIAGGENPIVIGESPDRDAVVVYPKPVTLVTSTVFQPGRYVFCNGLEMASGRITGNDVLLYVAGGTLNLRAAATVDMTGRAGGTDASLLIWVAPPDQTITIVGGPHAINLRGFVYAPTAKVELTSDAGTDIGGLIAKALKITGPGTTRIGPVPSMTIDPAKLPLARQAESYSATMTAAGGVGPYVWSKTGLPATLTMNPSTGVISGTAPSAVGDITGIIVTVHDSTNAAVSIDYTLSVKSLFGVFFGHDNIDSDGKFKDGTTTYSDPTETYTMTAGKGDIGGQKDDFQFLYGSMTGDVRLTAKVVSFASNDGAAQAGVMFRETLGAGSSYAMTDILASSGGEFVYRNGADTDSITLPIDSPGAPYWLRLTRVGDLFTAEWSADGVNWVGFEQTTIAMPPTIYVGLGVSSKNNSTHTEAIFDHVAITTPEASAPIVTATIAGLAYIENGTSPVDSGIRVVDASSPNLVSATVAITSGYANGQDTLAFVNQNGITGSWDPGTGVLALTGSALLADYQAALRSITYTNNSDSPNTTARTVTFIANDGGLDSNIATGTITVAAVNDAPVNSVPGSQITALTPPKTFSAGNGNLISISDADAGSSTMRVQLVAVKGTTTLSGIGGLAFTVGDGTADATMTFTGTITNVNVALAGLRFNPTAAGAGSLQIVTSDQGNTGSGGAAIDNDTIVVTVDAVAPVVTATATALAYVENGTTAVDTGIKVTDVDSPNLSSAKVTITAGYASGQDTLAFVTRTGIVGTFDATTGALTMSGETTVANYQAALRTVTYKNTSDAPTVTPRTLTFVANDGLFNSNIAARTMTIAAVNDVPVVTTSGGTMNYSENDTSVLDSGITVTDVDSANLSSVTVDMTTAYTVGQDFLFFSPQNSITSTWTASTGVLLLSGSSSVANYQAALRSITYNNSSHAPTIATRTVTFVAKDSAAALSTPAASRTITLTAVNDGPVNTVPAGVQTMARNTVKIFSGTTLISISDLDAGTGVVQVQLISTLGTVTLPVTTGLTIKPGDTFATDADMTFTGTVANINLRLNGLKFNAANVAGSANLRIITTDQGLTGSGGTLTDDDAVAITLT